MMAAPLYDMMDMVLGSRGESFPRAGPARVAVRERLRSKRQRDARSPPRGRPGARGGFPVTTSSPGGRFSAARKAAVRALFSRAAESPANATARGHRRGVDRATARAGLGASTGSRRPRQAGDASRDDAAFGAARAGGRRASAMVLYDFLVMVKSSVPRNQLADILRRTGTRVLDAGGVITDITSYGTRTLAYEFTSPGEKHFEVRTARRRAAFLRENQSRTAAPSALPVN